MKKWWKFFAIIEYFIPWILVLIVKFFTEWGGDEENCIFAFLVGIFVQCIIGLCGFIGIRKQQHMWKERILFLVGIFPFALTVLLFLINIGYS